MSCSEWLLVEIGDICEVGSSKRIFASEYMEDGIPFFRSKEIIELANNNEVTTELFISKEKFEEIDRKFGSPKNGDILLSSIGANMGIPYYVNNSEDFYFKDGNVTWFKNFKDEINSRYLYYLIKSNYIQTTFSNIAIGSAQKALTIDSLKRIKINLPPLEEQEKIANILSSLDDKIELNNEMNKTLEEMAQSIFKRWFVDFEFPNEDGEPYKYSGGEMVESELGMIPKGWEIGTLDNIGIFKNGKKIKPELRDDNGKYIIYGSNGIIGKTDEVLQNNNCIILGRVGAYCGSVQLSLEPCWVTDNAIIATSKEEKYLPYLHRFLLNYPLRESAGGSAQPLINQSILKSIQTLIPIQDLFEKYYDISKEILFKINQNIKENDKLSEIRDTLLPKLMSGEIILD